MFIRRIPYESVERRRIHNWWLLLLRVGAMTLLLAAFARPFFREDPVQAAVVTNGAQELVVLLDRSASMGYGDHWTRAQAAARDAVANLDRDDRATLVLFDQAPEEVVRGTSNRGEFDRAVGQASVSSGATRYASALRLAQSLLSRSSLPRKHVVLISDFQRSGWERQEEIRLPAGATITPISVAEPETSDVAVSSVAIQRATFSGQERATLTAGLMNRGNTAMNALPVQLEIDGRVIETRELSLAPNASGSVTFDPVTVADANLPGAIRAGTDGLPADNHFYFVMSPSRPVSVLVIDADGRERTAGPYLSTVLGLGRAPSFKTDVVSVSRVVPAQLENRSVVVLNDSGPLPDQIGTALQRFVERGGGLLIANGDRAPLSSSSPLLPGTAGAVVDRTATQPGSLGFLDYSHQIFDDFKDPGSGSFANMRFLRYRRLTLGAGDRVLARFDDGSAAMAERRVGNGRVVALMSTLDGSWNDMPKHGMFLPLMHEVMTYLAQYEEPVAWYTVGRMLDISAVVGSLVRAGVVGATSTNGASGVVVSPSGAQVALGRGGVSAIPLSEQGVYAVRLSGTGDRRPYALAVNLDPAEADLQALQPSEFLASVVGSGPITATADAVDQPVLTPVDLEKKQSLWWYLFVGALLVLLGEAVVSNRLTVRSGARQRVA
jgi:hypothetical protein